MVDAEVKRILKGQNIAWNIVFMLAGGALFGAGMEIGRLLVRHSVRTGFRMQLEY